MASAALLVDWENLKIALLDGNYRFTTGELARRLRDSVAALAKSADQSLSLDTCIAFAPAMALDGQTSQALRANGMTPQVTHSGGQAADLAIAIRAMQLYYDQPVTEFFVIVSGDSDYLPLVEELNKAKSRCHIWGVDEKHTPYSIRRHPLVSYVASRLGLPVDDPRKISADQQLVFLFLCHRILDSGIHLGSVNFACQKLAELGVWEQSRVQQMWKLLSDQHVIDSLPGFERDPRAVRTRRLAYERDQEVLRPLWIADMVVQKTYRRGHLNRGELMSLLGRCGLPEASCASFLEALVTAGYLNVSGDEYLAVGAGARYGLVGAAVRVILAYYAVTCDGRQSTLGLSQLIKSHWPRFYTPGGHLNEAEVIQAGADAKESVSRATAMRVAAWTNAVTADGRKVRAIAVFEDHPLAGYVRRRCGALVQHLAEAGASRAHSIQYNDFVQHMAALDVAPWGSADVDAWLSLLAAERVITLRSGDIWLNNTPLREAMKAWA